MTALEGTGAGAQETSPLQDAQENPFELISYLLFAVRHSLEDREDPERPPRWVRIARVRDTDGAIGGFVKGGVDKFADALSWMVVTTLRVQEVLVETDAAKALTEVALDLVRAATDANFQNGIRQLVDQNLNLSALDAVNNAAALVEGYLEFIPDPNDIEVIGHELYRLLCIEQVPIVKDNVWQVDEAANAESPHVQLDATGKFRLLQWAFGDAGITTYGLGIGADRGIKTQLVKRLGARRVWETAGENLPSESSAVWNDQGEDLTVFSFSYGDGEESDHLDLVEVNNLLESLGYRGIANVSDPANDTQKQQFDENLAKKLKYFQEINDLPITGALDNPTINRLLHLDYDAKNIKRAKPFDASLVHLDPVAESGYLSLVNPDADHAADETIEPVTTKGYAYYPAGHAPASVPDSGGWINPIDVGSPRFVAIKSRTLLVQEAGKKWYDFTNNRACQAGFLSEGEAASGSYFFSAAESEPWVPGRCGSPNPGDPAPLYAGISDGTITRIYQWVRLTDLVANVPTTLGLPTSPDLFLIASVLQRSLYKETGGQSRQVDTGRIGLAVYDTDVLAADGVKTERPDPATNPPTWSAFSDMFPGDAMVKAAQSFPELIRKHTWVKREAIVHIPAAQVASATAALVILEGQLKHGKDIDAYFDDVKLRWEFRASS